MKFFLIKKNQKGKNKIFNLKQKDVFVFLIFNFSGTLTINFKVSGAKAYLFGLFIGQKKDNFKLKVYQNHQVKNSFSELLFKGVFRDESQFFYEGLIKIKRGAKKSFASQKNQCLILSPHCLVEVKPFLEIDNNNVSCNHSSTISQPNTEEIYYLNSRGLTKKQAENLIVSGFLEEIFLKLEGLNIKNQKVNFYQKKLLPQFYD